MTAEYPHCNPEVLHAPGTCQFCDLYPERQAMRAASRTAFTPAEANGWMGNVAQPAVEPPPDRSRIQTEGLGWLNPRRLDHLHDWFRRVLQRRK